MDLDEAVKDAKTVAFYSVGDSYCCVVDEKRYDLLSPRGDIVQGLIEKGYEPYEQLFGIEYVKKD